MSKIAYGGIVTLISDSGPVAKIVLLCLLAASIICWGVMLAKWNRIRRARKQDSEFLAVFWHGKTMDEILVKIDKLNSSPVAAVFKEGTKELKKFSAAENKNSQAEKVDNIKRAMTKGSTLEIADLEKHINWLATTASAAPFIGLFGTVWGIMTSFQGIGATGSANLAVVAPGISEALITTATGIAAAIPAVVGYNYFVGQIKRIALDMECFSQDFLNIVQRNVISSRKPEGT
ncbi:MAG: protein TolQ [Bdellovibrionota bacterium]